MDSTDSSSVFPQVGRQKNHGMVGKWHDQKTCMKRFTRSDTTQGHEMVSGLASEA